MTTHASLDAGRVATTAEQAVVYERHLGIRASTGLRVQGEYELARRVVLRSVERQALLAGCGRVHLEVAGRG